MILPRYETTLAVSAARYDARVLSVMLGATETDIHERVNHDIFWNRSVACVGRDVQRVHELKTHKHDGANA